MRANLTRDGDLDEDGDLVEDFAIGRNGFARRFGKWSLGSASLDGEFGDLIGKIGWFNWWSWELGNSDNFLAVFGDVDPIDDVG